MDTILEKEIKKIILMSKYNTKNTLNENYKQLITESTILGTIDNLLKSLVKEVGPETAGETGKYLKIGGEKYQIVNKAGFGKSGTYELKKGNEVLENINIGGVQHSVNDLVNLAKGNLDELTDGFTEKIMISLIKQAETDTILKKQLDSIAEKGFGDWLKRLDIDPKEFIDGLKYKYKGYDVDKLIDDYLSELFGDGWEKDLVKKHYFEKRKIYFTAKAAYDTIGQNLLTFTHIRDFFKEFIRAYGIVKNTFTKNIEEDFQIKVKESFEQFFLDLEDLVDEDALKLAKADDKLIERELKINKFREYYKTLVNESAFKKQWGDSWVKVNNDAINKITEEMEKVLMNQEYVSGQKWTKKQIEDLLVKLQEGDIQKMLDEMPKYIKDKSQLSTAKSWFTSIGTNLKEMTKIKEFDNKILKWIFKNTLGDSLPRIQKMVLSLINTFKTYFSRMAIGTHFGVYRLPSSVFRGLTRYGPGGKQLTIAFFQTWAELFFYKLIFGGLIKTGLFVIINAIEESTEWLAKQMGDDKYAVDIMKTEGSLADYFVEQYTAWFTKDYLIDEMNISPVKPPSDEILKIDAKIIESADKFRRAFLAMAVSDNAKEDAQKVIAEKEKIAREELNELIKSEPKTAEEYARAFERPYWQIKKDLGGKIDPLVKSENGYTSTDIETILKHLKMEACPNFSLKDENMKDIEKEFPSVKEKILKKFKELKEKNSDVCAGIFIGDNVYEVKLGKGYKHLYIDDEGKEQPLKNIVELINKPKKEKVETEPLKPKPEITPTQQTPTDQQKPIDANRLEVGPKQTVTPTQNKPTVTPTQEPVIDRNKSKGDLRENVMIDLIKKIILEEEEEKTLKMKDWDEIFTFQKIDDKNPGKYTDVKIKMDSVMDRMPHWRKKYNKICDELENCDDDGEDDSFVRAVIDTHPEVVRILFTKGLAHLTSSEEQEDLNEGLHSLLAVIREAKSVEVEVWSVYRHPSSPDKIWSLVKGDFKPKELSSMDVKMQKSPGNTEEKKKDSLSELKKKESDAVELLSKDEKKGLLDLPIKVRNKIKEKISKGWTTEEPPKELKKFYKEDNVNTIFAEDIVIYKLKPNESFFNFIQDKGLSNNIKRGFCRAIYYVEKEFDLPKEKMEKINEILDECEEKLDGKYGQNYL